jgi:hypothetical protein
MYLSPDHSKVFACLNGVEVQLYGICASRMLSIYAESGVVVRSVPQMIERLEYLCGFVKARENARQKVVEAALYGQRAGADPVPRLSVEPERIDVVAASTVESPPPVTDTVVETTLSPEVAQPDRHCTADVSQPAITAVDTEDPPAVIRIPVLTRRERYFFTITGKGLIGLPKWLCVVWLFI